MKGFLMKWASFNKDVKAGAAYHVANKEEKQQK